MSQLTFESMELQAELEQRGYTFVDHGVPADAIDDLIAHYAAFTDAHPDPSLEIINNMIKNPDELDDLDYTQNPAEPWNKYHTNYLEFAKPGGYTNRSLQTAALIANGRQVTNKKTGKLEDPKDDPKEYYHFHPNSTAKMNQARHEYGWGKLPQEVHELHQRFASIHRLGAEAIKKTYRNLEGTHPDLISKHFGPKDIQSSPVRLLFYHPDQGDELAESHFDKAQSTLQIAESHLGLWIGHPKEGLITRPPEKGVFFLGKGIKNENSYPNSTIEPGRHGVENIPEVIDGHELHGQKVARWAVIFFANSLASGTITDKSLTHVDVEPEQEVA